MTDYGIEQQNTDERLKEIFRRLMELYERHAQERQLIIKEKEEMNRLVQLLVSQTKEVGQYENGIRKRIQDCIKESANTAMSNVEHSIAERTTRFVEQYINKMNCMSQSLEVMIASYRGEKNKLSWKIFTTAILSAGLSCLLMLCLLNIKHII